MAGKPLSAAEIETYRRDGLVIPKHRLDPALLTAMRAPATEVVRSSLRTGEA